MIANYTSFLQSEMKRKKRRKSKEKMAIIVTSVNEMLHRNKFQGSRQTIPKDDTRGIPSNDYTPWYYNHVRN